MTLKLSVPQNEVQLKPRITVIGVGGAGGNAVNNMIQSNLEGVEFLVTNTDAQSLNQSMCDRQVQLGKNITQGLGAGSRPDVGRAAAEETLDEIFEHMEGSNMLFVTAGMGGGTGTGAAPVIARAAREKGILTVGVVTKPFHFEGVHRMRLAENGIEELTQYVDTLIIIPNQNLFRVANEKTTFADAFKMADDVLHSGVRGVTDLMVMPGLINLDFADIRSVMTEMGKAMMGTGEAEGDNRSIAAAEAAISNPLLDDVSMKGARGVLINITGGSDMTLFEVDEAANRIRDEVDPEANIIFGSTFDENLHGTMRISVVATGIDADEAERPKPMPLALVSARGDQERSAVNAAEEKREEVPAAAASATAAPSAASESADKSSGTGEGAGRAAALADIGNDDDRKAESELLSAIETEDEDGPAQEDAFIPPPAIEPEPSVEQESRQSAPARPDPFAEAEMANATAREKIARMEDRQPRSEQEAKPRSKAHSIFARVTGGGRSRESEEAMPRKPVEEKAKVTAETRPASRPMEEKTKAEEDNRKQSSLSGLERRERTPSSQQSEDILDIPTFLRRQAN